MLLKILIKNKLKSAATQIEKSIQKAFEELGASREENYFKYVLIVKPVKNKIMAFIFNEDRKLVHDFDFGQMIDEQLTKNIDGLPEEMKKFWEESNQKPSSLFLDFMQGVVLSAFYDANYDMVFMKKKDEKKEQIDLKAELASIDIDSILKQLN